MACLAAYTGGAFMGMNGLGNIITGLSARAGGLVVPVRDMTSSAWYLQYGPLWFAAIFCTGVFAAGMSTMAAQQMAMSANILTDFIFGWRRKVLNMKQAYAMSMFVIAFFGGIAVWWSIAWQDVLNIIIYSYEVLVSSLIVAFFGCFFFPRMTNKGVTMGAISGGFVAIFWQFVIKAYYNTMLPAGFLRDMPSVLPALSTCIILNLIGTYTSKPDYEKTIEFAKVYSLNRLQARAEAALAKYKGGAAQ
jgi:Na+/proline symporter